MNGLAAGFSVKVFFGGALGASEVPVPPAPLSTTDAAGAVTPTLLPVLLLTEVFMTEAAFTCGGEVVAGCCCCCCCWGGG